MWYLAEVIEVWTQQRGGVGDGNSSGQHIVRHALAKWINSEARKCSAWGRA